MYALFSNTTLHPSSLFLKLVPLFLRNHCKGGYKTSLIGLMQYTIRLVLRYSPEPRRNSKFIKTPFVTTSMGGGLLWSRLSIKDQMKQKMSLVQWQRMSKSHSLMPTLRGIINQRDGFIGIVGHSC